KQVHGIHIHEVTKPKQEVGEADGLYTESTDVLIGILTADCVPILLSEKSGNAVAALHAGWRGTYEGIVSAFSRVLQSKGQCPSQWKAIVGPSIGPCCYEVSEEMVENFKKKFS